MISILFNNNTFIIALYIINIMVALRSVHIMQLNSYNIDQQLLWYKQHKNDMITHLFLLVLSILLSFFDYISYVYYFICVYMAILYVLLVLFIEYLPRKQKKVLVWTKRVIRLFILMIVLFSIPVVCYYLTKSDVLFLIYPYFTALAPLVCLIAFFIMAPIESIIRKKYAKEASDILKHNDDIYNIGITGSFGKTSVKYFLSTILQSKYNVCFTKDSFNTPMGVTLTIKNELKSYDEIFVCEMGARRIGDIKEICEMVFPKAGIITEVAEQHLDTFKNIDNILKTKFELADYVVNNNINKNNHKNILLVNGDNEIIRKYIKEKYLNYLIGTDKIIYTYGFNENNDFYSKIINIDSHGTHFEFIDNLTNNSIEYNTILIGGHNVLNLTSAIAMASLLNVDISDIKNSIKRIQPVAHRLEIKKLSDNQILIDDAYNANIKGSKYAINTLTYFKDYTKIIITPGIVELGDKQYDLNKQFIKEAAKICDYILLVSEVNKKAMLDGLKEVNYSEYNYFHFNSFNEAYVYANMNIKEEKKVILIENDLTDNY